VRDLVVMLVAGHLARLAVSRPGRFKCMPVRHSYRTVRQSTVDRRSGAL